MTYEQPTILKVQTAASSLIQCANKCCATCNDGNTCCSSDGAYEVDE